MTEKKVTAKKNMLLKASAILKYLLDTDDKIDTLISCKPSGFEIMCYDQSLYEALGSIKDSDQFNFRKLVKFIESVDIISYKKNLHRQKPVLTDKRVDQLRKEAHMSIGKSKISQATGKTTDNEEQDKQESANNTKDKS